MTTSNRRSKFLVAFALTVMLSVFATHAASIAYRLGSDVNGLSDYKNSPNSFPVCKAGTTYMHYDGTPPLASGHLFATTNAIIENGMYTVGGVYTGTDVVSRIQTYENQGWNVFGVILYREDWLNQTNGTPGGSYTNDWRILTPTDISNIRTALKNSSLKCKNTLKLIQLLGSGATWNETVGHAQNFPTFPASELEYLRTNFDGVGIEVHIGYEIGYPDALVAMADVTKWTADNGKLSFVFMGGGAPTYEDLPASQLTYEFLWTQMLQAGVNYRANHIIYFRQGARPGNMVPESANNTLTHQQRWVINTIATNGTSLFIGDVPDQNIDNATTATVPFIVGEVEVPANLLTVSGSSSNPTLVANTNLAFRGRGTHRILNLTPNPGQTGVATITLMVSDGIRAMTNSFQLTVTAFHAVTASTGGDINDPNTWGGTVPVAGDTNTWRTGNQTINMSATNIATFYGDTFEVQTNGLFNPGKPTITLTLNKLILNGGTIYMANNVGLTMDLSGQQLTLNSGTLKAGTASSMDVIFQDGTLAGSGNINIAGVSAIGGEVQFTSSINTLGFTGVFKVATNGILDLPPIITDDASFGLNLSGTGKYLNASDIALLSLVINGTNLPPGIYAYTNFTLAQQALIDNNGGLITVVASNTPPMLAPVSNRTLTAGQTLVITNIATDNDVPAQTLTFSLLNPPADVTLTTNGIFTWRPAIAQSPSTNLISVVVTDNGSPSMSATNTFTVTVIQPAKPVISGAANLSNGLLTFTVNGTNGPDYIVLASTNLTSWVPLWTNYSPLLPFSYTNSTTNFSQRFYRVLLGP